MIGGILGQLLNEDPAGHEPVNPLAPMEHGDEKVLALRMKKKYQLGLLRQMLEQGGYGDLAKMSSFTKRDIDDDEY